MVFVSNATERIAFASPGILSNHAHNTLNTLDHCVNRSNAQGRRRLSVGTGRQHSKCMIWMNQTRETNYREIDVPKSMTLHFISKMISVDGRSSEQLRQHIESTLKTEGEPVRWAIVEADETNGTCQVDAVISRT